MKWYHWYTTSALSPLSLSGCCEFDKDAASGVDGRKSFLQLFRPAKNSKTKSSFRLRLCLSGDFIIDCLKMKKVVNI